MIKTIKFHRDIMQNSAMKGFTNATDAADYLVNHGVPFRDAHGIIGKLVLYCIEKDKAIDELMLDELKAVLNPLFHYHIYLSPVLSLLPPHAYPHRKSVSVYVCLDFSLFFHYLLY